jgi:hypothetical protein
MLVPKVKECIEIKMIKGIAMRSDSKLILACLLGMTACMAAPPPDTYTDSTGKTTVIQSDKEQCVSSCNDTYTRCMETFDARDNGGVNGPKGMFGASADCRDDLKNCLPQCQGR